MGSASSIDSDLLLLTTPAPVPALLERWSGVTNASSAHVLSARKGLDEGVSWCAERAATSRGELAATATTESTAAEEERSGAASDGIRSGVVMPGTLGVAGAAAAEPTDVAVDGRDEKLAEEAADVDDETEVDDADDTDVDDDGADDEDDGGEDEDGDDDEDVGATGGSVGNCRSDVAAVG
jgi:hypothetical protein